MSAATYTTADGEAVIDGVAFAAEAERLTNLALIDEWLAWYHPGAVAEWIVDGACERHSGIDQIRPAATLMADLWRTKRFRVRKHLQCATSDHVVLTFDGAFGGRRNVAGTEIWTIRDGLVVHHQMSVYLDVRPRASLWAQLRVVLADPSTAIAVLRLERGLRRESPPAGVGRTRSPAAGDDGSKESAR
jgi:hypothetical protein